MEHTWNGEPINNDLFGQSVIAVIDEIYILMKLHYNGITREQVEACIGLYERKLTNSFEEEKGFSEGLF